MKLVEGLLFLTHPVQLRQLYKSLNTSLPSLLPLPLLYPTGIGLSESGEPDRICEVSNLSWGHLTHE